MGVPRLAPYLFRHFPEAVKYFSEGEFSTTVDFLYLDANGLLHAAAQEVYHYGDNKSVFNRYAHLTEEEKRKKTYSLFFTRLIHVTKIIRPNKVLYIAIDGPAPLAKQDQQRERRYVSARDRLEAEMATGKKKFDSNSITPGTTFMLGLTRYINYAIRQEVNSAERWKGLQVYFSPPTVGGEGEHKLMDYIRNLDEKHRQNDSHCLFGPDADLIMLTLAAHLPKMYLFREDQYNYGKYNFLNMGIVRRKLAHALGQMPGIEKRKRDLDDVTNDFIVEGFFVGNDFLPKIQMFHLLEEGLEFMLKTYAETSRNGTANFLTVKSEFNLSGFKPFIAQLARYERQFLIEQVTTTDSKKKPPEPKFVNRTLLSNISEEIVGTKIERTLDFKNYRKAYYQKSEIDVETEPEKIHQMCADYLRTFIWVFIYYVHGLPAWRWGYEWHYAPLMHDFDRYIENLSKEEVRILSDFELQSPSLPFEQLLSVLPPTSSDLLPKVYAKLMLNPDSPLVQLGYYPDVFDFHIDFEGKLKDFQGVAILPFVDYDEIHKNYLKMTECCVPNIDSYARNRVGKARVYWYDPEYFASFASDMGDVRNLHVRHVEL